MTLGASLCLLLALAQQESTAPVMEARPSTSNVSIGEKFQVTVEARGPRGTAYEFPKTVADSAVDLTLSRLSSIKADAAVYDAQVFAIGKDGAIPEIEVPYKLADGTAGTARTSPVPLNVVSSLDPDDKNPSPADFAPPMPVLVTRPFWIASGAAGLLLVAGLVLLARRLRLPRKLADPTIVTAITPEEEALAGLETLAAGQSVLAPRIFYIQLIQILKQYLERRLEAPVLEMTSTETHALVKAHDWTAPHAIALRDLISSADLVKFGGATDAPNGERQIQLVREVVARIDRQRRAELDRQAREDRGAAA